MGGLLCCVRSWELEDVIRLVHINGYVEEMSRPVRVGEVMRANPQHFVGESRYLGIVHQTAILPPEAELQLGQIYFLLPSPLAQIRDRDPASSPSLRCLSLPNSTPLEFAPDQAYGRLSPFVAATAPPTFRIKQYDGVTKLLISKHYIAEFLSGNNNKRTRSGRGYGSSHGREEKEEQGRGSEEGTEEHLGGTKRVSTGAGSAWKPALETIMEVT